MAALVASHTPGSAWSLGPTVEFVGLAFDGRPPGVAGLSVWALPWAWELGTEMPTWASTLDAADWAAPGRMPVAAAATLLAPRRATVATAATLAARTVERAGFLFEPGRNAG